MALNETQKNILEATFSYMTDELYPEHIESFLQLLQDAINTSAVDNIQSSEIEKYLNTVDKKNPITSALKQLYKICCHPCPQNRSEGSPYVGQEPGMAVWSENGTIQREPLGRLGLTARHDPAVEAVTKKDVLEYLHSYLLKQKETSPYTQFLYACRASNKELIHSLLPTQSDSEKQNALIYTIKNNHPESTIYLLDQGIKFFTYSKDQQQQSLLPTAIYTGLIAMNQLATFELLLDRGLDPDISLDSGKHKNLLSFAVKEGNLDASLMLIKRGAKLVNIPSLSLVEAATLDIAIHHGKRRVIEREAGIVNIPESKIKDILSLFHSNGKTISDLEQTILIGIQFKAFTSSLHQKETDTSCITPFKSQATQAFFKHEAKENKTDLPTTVHAIISNSENHILLDNMFSGEMDMFSGQFNQKILPQNGDAGLSALSRNPQKLEENLNKLKTINITQQQINNLTTAALHYTLLCRQLKIGDEFRHKDGRILYKSGHKFYIHRMPNEIYFWYDRDSLVDIPNARHTIKNALFASILAQHLYQHSEISPTQIFSYLQNSENKDATQLRKTFKKALNPDSENFVKNIKILNDAAITVSTEIKQQNSSLSQLEHDLLQYITEAENMLKVDLDTSSLTLISAKRNKIAFKLERLLDAKKQFDENPAYEEERERTTQAREKYLEKTPSLWYDRPAKHDFAEYQKRCLPSSVILDLRTRDQQQDPVVFSDPDKFSEAVHTHHVAPFMEDDYPQIAVSLDESDKLLSPHIRKIIHLLEEQKVTEAHSQANKIEMSTKEFCKLAQDTSHYRHFKIGTFLPHLLEGKNDEEFIEISSELDLGSSAFKIAQKMNKPFKLIEKLMQKGFPLLVKDDFLKQYFDYHYEIIASAKKFQSTVLIPNGSVEKAKNTCFEILDGLEDKENIFTHINFTVEEKKHHGTDKGEKEKEEHLLAIELPPEIILYIRKSSWNRLIFKEYNKTKTLSELLPESLELESTIKRITNQGMQTLSQHQPNGSEYSMHLKIKHEHTLAPYVSCYDSWHYSQENMREEVIECKVSIKAALKEIGVILEHNKIKTRLRREEITLESVGEEVENRYRITSSLPVDIRLTADQIKTIENYKEEALSTKIMNQLISEEAISSLRQSQSKSGKSVLTINIDEICNRTSLCHALEKIGLTIEDSNIMIKTKKSQSKITLYLDPTQVNILKAASRPTAFNEKMGAQSFAALRGPFKQ